MWIVYFLVIKLYQCCINILAFFHPKAKAWVEGRKNWRSGIQQALNNSTSKSTKKRIWFHCASLGEFEQGRPLLEVIKNEYPDYLIILTFFSPSGFEIRKNTPLADHVFYLPLDGPKNSPDFIKLIQPEFVFFVKYEFWYFYGVELFKRKIPFYCVSAIFRPGQIYFQPGGDFFRRILLRYTHLFVQDEKSLDILYRNRIARVTVAGDTRFDAVFERVSKPVHLPEIKTFCADKKVMICGSTWPADEKILVPFINESQEGYKFIIAPHEMHDSQLQNLVGTITKKTCLYSEWKNNISQPCDVLVIDNVGMLSQLYSFGTMAFIGGGFGTGIHNILEAAGFGLPVFFGPKFQKFLEAKELIAMKGAFSIKDKTELERIFHSINQQESLMTKIAESNKRYVESRKGATKIVMNYLSINRS